MQTASKLAVDYAINALWLLPLLVLVAEVTAKLLGRSGGKTLYRIWVTCLLLALTVPALPLLEGPAHALNYGWTHGQASAPARAGAHDSVQRNGRGGLHLSFSGGQFDRPAQIDRRTTDIPSLILSCALYVYLASVLFALIRLTWGLGKTRSLLHSAQTTLLRQEARESWESCLKLFGKARVKLMSSSRLGGPATVSWPGPIVLLPAKLRDEDANEMTAVFCHELAHVQRNDFLYNIFMELFGVLLFYHPAFHWMRRRIQEARELACDDMAADAMTGRHVYAQSLLRLTEKMLSAAVVPQPGCALGIFEGEVLERRIMNLLENRSRNSRLRVFTSLVTGLCLLLGTCVLSTNLGLKLVNAQSAIQADRAPSGWFLAGTKPANYQTGIDKAEIENGQQSAYLRSVVPVSDGFGTLMQSISAADYAGKRVRIRAWVKSQDVAESAGVWMRVDKDKTVVAFDNMQKRAIKGTQPWKTCDVVLDVPEDATGISFGVLLSGTGEVWINDVSFEVVGKEIPTTNPAPVQTPALPSHPVNLKFTE